MTVVDTGLAGEYAAIYAYGAVAVHLSGAPRDLAEALEAEHRERRDALLDFYDEHGLEAVHAEAAYDIEPIGDAATAQALLLDVEERLTTTWRAGVASEDPAERETDEHVEPGLRRRHRVHRVRRRSERLEQPAEQHRLPDELGLRLGGEGLHPRRREVRERADDIEEVPQPGHVPL